MKTLTLLIILLGNSSCALFAKPLVPALNLRTLEISPDKPGAYYMYCAKKKFLSKKCKNWVKDFYDFTDEAQRNKLRDAGFVLKVRDMP